MIKYYYKYKKYKSKYKKLFNHNMVGGAIPPHAYKYIFPYKNNIDYSQLQLTDEGEYSITKKHDGDQIYSIMQKELPSLSELTITDGTGNVGGDTILFGLHFKKVISFEINKENFKVLNNNIKVYGLTNVKTYNKDTTIYYNKYTDVLYLDPPWGGVNYKESDNIDLYLGKYRIDEYVDYIIQQSWKPKYIFLKLPKNSNFSRFDKYNTIKYDIVNKNKEIRFNIIFIKCN
jgi:16S rRNA G966 N2-methylase RsmD